MMCKIPALQSTRCSSTARVRVDLSAMAAKNEQRVGNGPKATVAYGRQLSPVILYYKNIARR